MMACREPLQFEGSILWENSFDKTEQYHLAFHGNLIYKLNLYDVVGDVELVHRAA